MGDEWWWSKFYNFFLLLLSELGILICKFELLELTWVVLLYKSLIGKLIQEVAIYTFLLVMDSKL